MSEPEPKQERRGAWVWWAGGLAALLTVCAALQPILLPWPSPVTREAYDRIEKGMTRAEVERMLGGPPGDYQTRPASISKHVCLLPWNHGLEWSDFVLGGVEWCGWKGDKGQVEVGFDRSGVAADKWFQPANPDGLGFLDLIRWRLNRVKDRWFPPSP